MDAATAGSIIDEARSETKRWGGTEPTLTHAAYVLSRRSDAVFAEVFGADAEETLAALLGAQRFRGTEAELAALVADATDHRAMLLAMRAAIEPDLTASAGPAVADGAPTAPLAPGANSAEPSPTHAGSDPPAAEPERRFVGMQLVAPEEGRELRAHEAAEVAAEVLRQQPMIAAVIGERGSGRTSVFSSAARLLAALPAPIEVWRLAPDTVIANPTATLRAALAAIETPTVIAIDDLDVLADLATDSPNRDLLDAINKSRFHPFARVVVAMNKRYSSRVAVVSQAMADALAPISLAELPPDDVAAIARAAAARMATSRGLVIDEPVIAAALAPGLPTDGAAQPGLAIARLDRACARAVLAGHGHVGVAHLGAIGDGVPLESASHNLALVLEARVRGQEDAIAKVAARLTITRAKLDLRPERPNGVFLFVGPTGVGKTELAREIAVHEYGGADRLIRLDMSEYAQEWSISRIAGPAPGYVGSTEPESWLTTKVAAMPRCVVLLDEVEKAHPRVWNTFLQVFDAGRLTDGRGVTADFSDTVTVMTSNLGVKEASSRAIGFGDSDNRASRDRLMAVVREHMAPELLNRMDEVITFNSLSMQAIVEIADYELNSVCSRLSAAGWAIEWTPAVSRWLAESGYDSAYGARHLQRNIEQEFLARLAVAPGRRIHVDVADGALDVTTLG